MVLSRLEIKKIATNLYQDIQNKKKYKNEKKKKNSIKNNKNKKAKEIYPKSKKKQKYLKQKN